MKNIFALIFTLTIALTSCKNNETSTTVTTAQPAANGAQLSVSDTSLAKAQPSIPLVDLDKKCYKGNGVVLSIEVDDSVARGKITITEGGNKINTDYLGSYNNDTVSIMTFIPGKQGQPSVGMEFLFAKSGDNYVQLTGSRTKDDKNVMKYSDRKSLTASATLSVTACN
jgi:hypothetical protein